MLLPSKLTSRGQAVYAAHKQALAEQLPKLKDPACALSIANILHKFCEQMPRVVTRTPLARAIAGLHDLIRALTEADCAALSAETRELAAELLVSELPALAGLAASLQEIDLKAPLETYRHRLGEEGYVRARLESELARLRERLDFRIRLLLPPVRLDALARNPAEQPCYNANSLPPAPSVNVENLHEQKSTRRRAGGQASPQADQDAADGNLMFRKTGRYWKVVLDGTPEILIENTLGARYLDYLLHNPNEPISAYELEITVTREKGDVRSKDSIQKKMDGKTIRTSLQELDKLRLQRDEANDDGEWGKCTELDAQIGSIEATLKKKKGTAADTGERARQNVSKAIVAVQRKLLKGEKYEKAFGTHIKECVSMGYTAIAIRQEVRGSSVVA